jgi:hypothetical protein
MMTVGVIRKLDQRGFKLPFPSRMTGMLALKEMIICLIVVLTGGATICILDWIVLVNQRANWKYLVQQLHEKRLRQL